MLLVLASQALTDCATKTVLFLYSKYTYFGAGAANAVFRDTATNGYSKKFESSILHLLTIG